MGYNFKIGNAKLDYNVDRSMTYIEKYVRVNCDSLYSEECPEFTDSGKNSRRDPSYSGWSEFCERVGLEEVFYNKSKKRDQWVLQDHPGVYPLTQEDLEEFQTARDLFRKCYPNSQIVTYDRFPPEYRELNFLQREAYDNNIPKEDWDLSRLEWLCFWTEYALKNCEYPIFRNT